MINVGSHELGKVWKVHHEEFTRLQSNTGDSCSAKLLLFYAVEIALKYCYCIDNRIRDSDEFMRAYEGNGHDLFKLCEFLRLAKADLGNYQVLKSKTIQIHTVHEYWRYGGKLDRKFESDLVQWLKHMISVLKKRLENG